MSQWDMVKLGEVCRAESSNLAQKSLEDISGSFPVYGASGLVGYMDSFKQDKPYIAVIKDGAGVGRTYILPRESSILGTMQYILPMDSTDIRFLYYGLTSLHLERYARGATIPHIYFKDYKESEIPLPPLETQQHMAKTLDIATEIIEGYRQKLTELEKLVQSVFYEMFGDGKFSCVRVETISKKLTDGTHQSPTFTDIGVPFLFVSNIVNNEIEYKTNRFIGEEEYTELIKRTPIEVGDILITVVGSYGNVAIVKKMDKFCFQRHIAYIKPDFGQVTSFFLKYALLSTDVQREIDRNVRGAAQKTLTLTELRGLSIPLPPLPLQEQFAQIVEKIEEKKALVQEGLREAEQLFGGLLQGYFEG